MTWITPPSPELVTIRICQLLEPSQPMAMIQALTVLLTTLSMDSDANGLAQSPQQQQFPEVPLEPPPQLFRAPNSSQRPPIQLLPTIDLAGNPPRTESPSCGESRVESSLASREALKQPTPTCLMITLWLGLVLSVDLHLLEQLSP